jgi:predicted lipid-binding transport protein (Tim44 family)
MKRFLMMLCAGVLALGLTVQDAEAKRLGGGSSKGMQRESVTQRQATPPTQATPHAPAATPAAPTPAAQPKRSWMGPLAGLAAGLGIAALMSHFGMGEAMGNMMMVLLLVAVALFAFKFFMRKSQPVGGLRNDGLQYAGAGNPVPSAAPVQSFEPVLAAQTVADVPPEPAVRNIPADFDQVGFLRVAKVNFIRLQAANDAGNLDDLREFTTPEMFAEIKMDIAERQGAMQETNVQTVEAELLEVVSEASRHIASVRFHGMISEQKGAPAERFDEVWHLVKPIDNSRGWAIAGIQQVN